MLSDVEIAEKQLQIVQLRNLAGWQRGEYAQSHIRQARHPIYPGQEDVCLAKAAQAERLASENEAKANLMEATLESAIKA